jgi:hypothetical protein
MVMLLTLYKKPNMIKKTRDKNWVKKKVNPDYFSSVVDSERYNNCYIILQFF